MEHKSLKNRLMSGTLAALVAVMELPGGIEVSAAKEKFRRTLTSVQFNYVNEYSINAIAADTKPLPFTVAVTGTTTSGLENGIEVSNAHWISTSDEAWTDDSVFAEDGTYKIEFDAFVPTSFNSIEWQIGSNGTATDVDFIFDESELTILSCAAGTDADGAAGYNYTLRTTGSTAARSAPLGTVKAPASSVYFTYGSTLDLEYEAYGSALSYCWYYYDEKDPETGDFMSFEGVSYEYGDENAHTDGKLHIVDTSSLNNRRLFCRAYNDLGTLSSDPVTLHVYKSSFSTDVSLFTDDLTAGSPFMPLDAVDAMFASDLDLRELKLEDLINGTELKYGDTIRGGSDYRLTAYYNLPTDVDPATELTDYPEVTVYAADGTISETKPWDEIHQTSEGLGYNFSTSLEFTLDDEIIYKTDGIIEYYVNKSKGYAYAQSIVKNEDLAVPYPDFLYNSMHKDLSIPSVFFINDEPIYVLGIFPDAFSSDDAVETVTFRDIQRRINDAGDMETFEHRCESIGAFAFADCTSLTSVELPDHGTLTTIGDGAFFGCSALTDIGSKSSAGTYILPDSVRSIGSETFKECTSLAPSSSWISGTSSLETIGYRAFYNASIVYPNFYNVTTVGAEAFKGTKIGYLTFPKVEEVGDRAFAVSTAAGMEMNGNAKFGENVFDGCTGISSVTITGGVSEQFREILDTIAENGLLDKLTLFMEEIPYAAFDGCTWLKAVNMSSVRKIGSYAFRGTGLTAANIPTYTDEASNIHAADLGEGVFKDCTDLTFAQVPNAMTYLPAETFSGDTALERAALGGGLTSIGAGAFYHCFKFKGFYETDTYYLPETLTNIGESAFMACEGITDINIPNVTHLGASAFENCTNATTVTFSDLLTEIPDRAFCMCLSIDNVVLPESLTSIGKNAFTLCRALTSIDIPEGVEVIGENAFGDDIKLEVVTLHDGLKKIDDYAFMSSGVKTIAMPDTVTSIGDFAFKFCKSLETVKFSDSLETIGKDAFYDCPLLREVILSDLVTEIGDGAFGVCSGIETLRLSENINSIGEEAFKGCTKLYRIDVPGSCSYIGSNAFASGPSDGGRMIVIRNPEADINVHIITKDLEPELDSYAVTLYVIKDSTAHKYASEFSIPYVIMTDLSSCVLKFKNDISSFKHTGAAIEPEFTVETDDGTLIDASQYITELTDNTDVGTAHIRLLGIDLTVGVLEQDFIIEHNCETGDHLWSKWEITTEPTCTGAGEQKRVCTVCGETETDIVEPLGHDWSEWELDTAPTCINKGNYKRTCFNCEEFEYQDIPIDPEAHEWCEWYVDKAAACEENGVEKRYCIYCAKEETREIPATGHDMSEWMRAIDPTCTEDGDEYRYCNNSCGLEEHRAVEATGHSWSDWEVSIFASCIDPGEEMRFCEKCAESECREIPAAGGHDWGEWTVWTPASCFTPGVERRICNVCSEEEYREVPAAGEHSWAEWVEVSAPSCLTDGEETHVCEVCGEYESRTVPAYGEHDWDEWTINIAATCTTAGEEIRYCLRCYENETRIVDALGHDYTFLDTSTNEEGITVDRYVCSRCGDVIEREAAEIPKSAVSLTMPKGGTYALTGVDAEGNDILFDAGTISGVDEAYLVNGAGSKVVWTCGGEVHLMLPDGSYTVTDVENDEALSFTIADGALSQVSVKEDGAWEISSTSNSLTVIVNAETKPVSETTEIEGTETTVSATEMPSDSSETTVPATETTPASSETTVPATETTPNSSETTVPTTETTPASSKTTVPATETTPVSSGTTVPATETTPNSSETTVPATETTPASSETTVPATETTPASSETTVPATETTPDSSETMPAETDPPDDDMLGDINGDGLIDSVDASLILVYNADSILGVETLTPEQLARADINGDGMVDSVDASLILVYNASKANDPELKLRQMLDMLKQSET